MSDRLTAYAQYLVDNKGKSDSAEYRTVMSAYMEERSKAPAPQHASPPETGNVLADSMQSVGDAMGQIGRSVIDAARGPQGLPEMGAFPMGPGTRAKTMLTNDPAAQTDIFRKDHPNASMMPVEADGKRYTVAAEKDEKTGQVKSGYLNEPGLDEFDAARFGSQAAAFTPAAKWASAGKSLVGRAVKGFAGGASTDLALQKGAQGAGSEQPTDYGNAALIGAFGTALETVAPIAKAGWRKIFKDKDMFNPNTGTLTPRGKKAARDAGLNPDEMDATVSKEFARLMREGNVDPNLAARSATNAEFGLPASRGQLSQDYRQLNLEDRMRRGLEGEEAMSVMKGADDEQVKAIGGAQKRVQKTVAGRDPVDRPAEAGEIVQKGIRGRERAMRGEVDDAYAKARETDEATQRLPFTFNNAKEVPDFVSNKLAEASAYVDDLTPAARKSMEAVSELAKGNPSLISVDRTRRMVSRNINAASTPEDKRTALLIKKGLDDWTDDAVEKGLFTGDEAVVEQLKRARGLRAEMGRLFEPKGKYDTSGKVVQDILKKAETPEQVVNFIFGASNLGGRAQAAGAVKRIGNIVGKDSDEWGAMKEIAWLKLSKDKKGEPLSSQAFDKSWNEFKQNNKSLLDEMFSPNEQALIGRYQKALATTRRDSTNASQSAFALEGALRYTLRRLGQRESFTKGNVGTGTLLQAMARAPINPMGTASIARERMARQAISPLDTPRRRAPLVPAAGESGYKQREGY